MTLLTGRGLCSLDELYDALNYMTGESVFTHQIPRAIRECAEPIVRQHPELAGVDVPPLSGQGPVDAWLATQTPIYGEFLTLSPLSDADHTSIDPLTELGMMVPVDRIIAVEVER